MVEQQPGIFREAWMGLKSIQQCVGLLDERCLIPVAVQGAVTVPLAKVTYI
jgi:hypothetical protein